MARWHLAATAGPLLCAACLFPSLGDLEGGARVGGDAGSDASADDASDAGNDAKTDAATDAGPSVFFTDDFNRADGPSIGNGWLTKDPSGYALKSGMVRWLGDAQSYRDHLVRRPPTEDRLDVKAQMTVVFGVGFPGPAYPQIDVRVQSATAANPDAFDGYIFYVEDDPTVAQIARQRGTSAETKLSAVAISPALQEGKSYRLALSAVGTNPVILTASIEQNVNNQWTFVVKQSVSDFDPQRIDTAGAVGFSGGNGSAGVYNYDDFSTSTP
jgi:hypothetical protein